MIPQTAAWPFCEVLAATMSHSLRVTYRFQRWTGAGSSDCGPRGRFRAATTAAALGCGVAYPLLYFPIPADWMGSWKGIADLYLSLWIVLFAIAVPVLWGVRALVGLMSHGSNGSGDGDAVEGDEPQRYSRQVGRHTAGHSPPDNGDVFERACGRSEDRLPWWWALALLLVCAVELLTHSGERNGWVASSRPTSGVETWTTADGYSILLDGIPAQGDGRALLPMLSLFAGDGPPEASEFDRRAGHVFLVSLLQRPLGVYWSFATVNLLGWWAAALALWYLGQRRWPGTSVAWLASLFVATGQGFIFVGAAPQAHGPALAAFALVLALCEALRLWHRAPARRRAANWAKVGWATGAAGLIYLAQVPALLFLWLYGVSRVRDRSGLWRAAGGALLASVVALAFVEAWQVYAAWLLGLSFAGGNNDLAGEAARNWLAVARRGVADLVGQLHAASPRGLLGAAFYYPWWLLTLAGYAASDRDNRRWALAVLLAGGIPAIAFSTRFDLPRIAYFMFPAVYLLAARGLEVVVKWSIPRAWTSGARGHPGQVVKWSGTSGQVSGEAKGLRPARNGAAMGLAVAMVVGLVALSNVDLVGIQQLNLWFHYSQGNAW